MHFENMQIKIKSKMQIVQLHQDFWSAEIRFDWQICITLSLLVHVKAV